MAAMTPKPHRARMTPTIQSPNARQKGMHLNAEIEQRAAELVRSGRALPLDAAIEAREQVLREHQIEAQER